MSLEKGSRMVARRAATALVGEIPAGEALSEWFGAVNRGPGLLLLDGVIALDMRVGDRTATELVGPGDLLQPIEGAPPDALIDRDATWRALEPSHLALLDAEFADRVRPWPAITGELMRRIGRRASEVAVQRAICAQPRLDLRLSLILWHLAARWGKVEPGGIRLSLPLTHRMLGQLVKAERPSVTHALARLSRSGLVTGNAGDLHLCGTLESHLAMLVYRGEPDEVAAPATANGGGG